MGAPLDDQGVLVLNDPFDCLSLLDLQRLCKRRWTDEVELAVLVTSL